ncbi:MAG: hypothetical protein ACR2KU_06410 [Gammaproteobacteria bacterium]|nr:hypothetical protein [Gammaproteobacteria bacterium]MBA3732177.1 hypothetical protein [Gammaproteobacteria bacterium]
MRGVAKASLNRAISQRTALCSLMRMPRTVAAPLLGRIVGIITKRYPERLARPGWT